MIEFSVDCKNRREVPPSPLPLLPLLVFDDLRWPLLRQLAASVDGQKQGEGEGGGLFLIWATECCRLNSCLAKFYGLPRPNLIIVASDRFRFRFHILFVLPFLHVCITFAPQLSPHPSTLIRYSQSLGRMKSRDAFFFGPLARMPLSFPSKKVRTMCIFARFGFLIEFSVDCKNRRDVPPIPPPPSPSPCF